MSWAYFTPDERLIFYCRKDWFPLFTLFLFGILLILPIGFIPLLAKVPLNAALTCILSPVIYFTFCFLGVWGYRKSYLVLSNRRLFLRYGFFFPKDQVIPFETIESITFYRFFRFSHYLISTTDGKKVAIWHPFRGDDLKRLAAHINALKNGTPYLEPEKIKAINHWIAAVICLGPIILVFGLYLFFGDKEIKQPPPDIRPRAAIKKKVIKADWKRDWLEKLEKMTRMVKEYKRLASLDITSRKKSAEGIMLWKSFLAAYSDDIPVETTDERLKKDAWEMIIRLQECLPPGDPLRGTRLRSVYNENLREEEWRSTLKKYGFFDSIKNECGGFRNQYQVIGMHGDKVVLDYTTGLMWHPGGSQDRVPYKKIPLWLNRLNRNRYAGFDDWRLPTLEEAASLLQKAPKSGISRFIDGVFSRKESPIYTGDRSRENPPARSGQNECWKVSYRQRGSCYREWLEYESYIRPVRSKAK